jgi:hypothetical protein
MIITSRKISRILFDINLIKVQTEIDYLFTTDKKVEYGIQLKF